MVTRKLAEKVNELIDFNSYGFENVGVSIQAIEEHFYTIYIDLWKFLDEMYFNDEYSALSKLWNRFDFALENWGKIEKKEWENTLLSNWEARFLFDHKEDYSDSFLTEKFSEIKVEYIQKLKSQIESYKIESYKNDSYKNDSHRTTSETKEAKFTLHPKQNKKTDLIRILNALWGLGIIYKSDLNKPTKEEFMREMGNVFGVDLTNSHKDLSQAFHDCSLETNLKVFETMLKFTKEEWLTKNR